LLATHLDKPKLYDVSKYEFKSMGLAIKYQNRFKGTLSSLSQSAQLSVGATPEKGNSGDSDDLLGKEHF
jgi:hypothetical protein